MHAAVVYHQLAVNLTGVFGEVCRYAPKGGGFEPQPLQLGEFSVGCATLPAMPEHSEHPMGGADVESVKIHGGEPY